MPMWMCDYDACTRPAVRTYGECVLCNRHLCSQHLQTGFHECPVWQDEQRYDAAAREAERLEINRLIDSVDTAKLAERASILRDGMDAQVPTIPRDDRSRMGALMGGMNYHVEIRFSDGVVWLARIRRFNATSPPPVLRDYIIQSEVATLKFLERTAVPAPKVFGWALDTDESNRVGTGYILMEKLPGRSFDRSQASDAQVQRVIEQLAHIYTELRTHPFPLLGSLNQPGTAHIGPFAREALVDFDGSRMVSIGPCSSTSEVYTASIQLILALILRQEMYSEQAVDAYLIHRFLLDVLPGIEAGAADGRPFFLKHADEKGDQILVDETYTITGVIDWEWAHSASSEFAFNSPIMLLPVAKFYEGEQAIGDDEEYFALCLQHNGADDLAHAVRQGRGRHFFSFCCGYDLSDWEGFLGLFRGLRTATGTDEGLEWVEWKERALKRYSADEGLRQLLSEKRHKNT